MRFICSLRWSFYVTPKKIMFFYEYIHYILVKGTGKLFVRIYFRFFNLAQNCLQFEKLVIAGLPKWVHGFPKRVPCFLDGVPSFCKTSILLKKGVTNLGNKVLISGNEVAQSGNRVPILGDQR